MTASFYPVHVEAHIDPELSRWQWLFKWLLAIPHYVILAFLWVAFVVLSVIAFFAILFTGRYPRGIFDFNVGVLRWSWRVSYYAYGALGTDRYPPFSLEERADYPAHLEVDYPDRLSRGLVLVKSWLLAIPHYLVVGLFVGGAGWVVTDAVRSDAGRAGGAGLLGLLVLFAGVALLFSGRYPRAIFDLVLGLNRWVLRVAAYAALMTDVYPPFRLDQGGDDPTTWRATPAPAAPVAARTGSSEHWPSDPATPHAQPAHWPTDPATPHLTDKVGSPTQPPRDHSPATRPWGAGRVFALVAGSILLLGSVAVGFAGGALAVADHALRDADGYLMSDTTALTTSTYALASTSVEVHADAPPALMPERLLGDLKVTADGGQTPTFVGIARTLDANAYLRGVEHATVTDFTGGPVYDTSGTTAPPVPPTQSNIWVVRSSGSGSQQIVWPVTEGDWTLVVMNADGSHGVQAQVAAGVTVPALDWLAPTLLATGAVGLLLGALLVTVALRTGAPRSVPGA
jgi:hypothetical protein